MVYSAQRSRYGIVIVCKDTVPRKTYTIVKTGTYKECQAVKTSASASGAMKKSRKNPALSMKKSPISAPSMKKAVAPSMRKSPTPAAAKSGRASSATEKKDYSARSREQEQNSVRDSAAERRYPPRSSRESEGRLSGRVAEEAGSSSKVTPGAGRASRSTNKRPTQEGLHSSSSASPPASPPAKRQRSEKSSASTSLAKPLAVDLPTTTSSTNVDSGTAFRVGFFRGRGEIYADHTPGRPKTRFSPSEHARQKNKKTFDLFLDTLSLTQKTLDIAVYSITSPDIVKKILELKYEKNVRVRVVADLSANCRKDWKKLFGSLVFNLAAHVPLLVYGPGIEHPDNHKIKEDDLQTKTGYNRLFRDADKGGWSKVGSLMHHKLAVIDSKIAVQGSFNWTTHAQLRNQENFIVVDEREGAKNFQSLIVPAYAAEFESLWRTLRACGNGKNVFGKEFLDQHWRKHRREKEKLYWRAGLFLHKDKESDPAALLSEALATRDRADHHVIKNLTNLHFTSDCHMHICTITMLHTHTPNTLYHTQTMFNM